MSDQNLIVSTSTPEAPANAIKPRLGDRPKRGIKTINLKIANKSAAFRPHHQKSLIIDLMEFKQGEATVLELVDLIEANPAYWARLNTVQSPYNCVIYHAKQLADAGYLTYEEVSAPGQTKERKGADPAIEVVRYSKSKAIKASDLVRCEELPTESVADVEAELGIGTEIKVEHDDTKAA